MKLCDETLAYHIEGMNLSSCVKERKGGRERGKERGKERREKRRKEKNEEWRKVGREKS